MRNGNTLTQDKEKTKEQKPLFNGHETDSDKSELSDSEVELTTSANFSINADDINEVCPITLEVPKEPVVASDGHTYEKDQIKPLADAGKPSPLTREILSPELRPNHTYKKQVETTTRLAKEKYRAEKEKDKYKNKAEQAKKERIIEKAKRRAEKDMHRKEEAAFRTEMRESMARQEVRMEEVLSHVKANKELIRQYQAVYHNGREQDAVEAGLRNIGIVGGTGAGLAVGTLLGFVVAEAVEAGIGLGTMVTFGAVVGGTTAASGGLLLPVWAIIIISAGAGIAIGMVIGYFVGKHYALTQDERDYKRDQPLLERLNQTANAHALDQFLAATNGRWALHGTGHGAYYVLTEILTKISQKLVGWLQDGPMETQPKLQAVAHLQSLDSNLSVSQEIQREPVYQRLNHLKEQNVLPRVEQVSGPHILDNSAVTAINSAMHSGPMAEVACKKAMTLHMASTVIEQAVKAVEQGTPKIEIAPIFRGVQETEKGYRRNQSQVAALPTH